jgi:Cu(I)/Ag(I) efflux system membrane protein CusA/SilA
MARRVTGFLLLGVAMWVAIRFNATIGVALAVVAGYRLLKERIPVRFESRAPILFNLLAVAIVGIVLTGHWLPLGPERGFILNLLFVAFLVASIMIPIWLFMRSYDRILGWCLENKKVFLAVPIVSSEERYGWDFHGYSDSFPVQWRRRD